MIKLIRNFSLAYTSSLFSVVLTLWIARSVGVDRFSDYAAGLAIGGMLAVLANIGSQRTFVRHAVRVGPDKVQSIAAEGFSRRISLYCLLSIIIASAVPILFGARLDNPAITVFVALWAGLVGLYPQSWFDYERRSHDQLKLVLVERVFSLLVVLVILQGRGVDGLLLIASLLFGVRLASLTAQVRLWNTTRTTPFIVKFGNPLRDAPGTSVSVLIPLFSNSLLTYGNQLFLLHGGASSDLSSYSIAFSLMSIAIVFQGQLLRILNRGISDSAAVTAALIANTLRYSFWMMAGSCLVGMTMYFASPLLPLLLNDNSYNAIQTLLLPMTGWVVVLGAGKIVTQHLIELGEEIFYMWSGVCGAALALLLAAVFVPNYGGVGVAAILFGVRSLLVLISFGRLYAVTSRLE